MHPKTLLLISTFALATSALPQPTPIPDTAPFKLQTFHFQHPVQGAILQAAHRTYFVNLPAQNATCTPNPEPNTATFSLKDQELRHYQCASTSLPGTNQTVFVDRSGMGQGKIGYITGAEDRERYWETKGWALDENRMLVFEGMGLQACPSIQGAWALWFRRGVERPGVNENCTHVAVAATAVEDAVGCVYSL